MSQSYFEQNLLAIYDAAFARDRWTPALDAMVSGTSIRAAVLYETSDLRDIAFTVNAVSTAYVGMADRLAEYTDMLAATNGGSGLDREGVTRLHCQKPFVTYEESTFWTLDDAYNSRPEIKYVLKEFGSYRRSVINLSEDPLSYCGAIFHYGLEHQNIPPKDLKSVARYAPHLAKSIELNRLSFSLRQKYNAVLSVLDNIDLGICILRGDGAIVLRNKKAGQIFQARDGVWKQMDGRLACSDDDNTAQLRIAASRIAQTANGENDDRSEEIIIRRRSLKSPLLLILSPLRDADMELESGLTGVFLTIVDTETPVNARLDSFCVAHGLTPTERRVAPMMFNGNSNSEIGEALNISAETAKSHVAAIFRKTQCRNRIAFVWRVFQFAPPII